MVLVLESWNVLDLWKRLKRLFEKDVSSAPQTCLSQVAQRQDQSEQPREQVGKRSVICRPMKGGKKCVGNDRLPSLLGKNRQTFHFSLWKNLKVPLAIPLTYLDFPNKIYGWIVLAKAQVRCSEHSQGKIMQVHQSLFSLGKNNEGVRCRALFFSGSELSLNHKPRNQDQNLHHATVRAG